MKDVCVCVFLLLLMVFEANGQTWNSVSVETPQGRVHGYKQTTEFGKVRVFLGLPFAKPPVGNLRLRPPVAAATFSDYNATYNRPNCIQAAGLPDDMASLAKAQSEDCLYLNVFAPDTITKSVAVMVFFHGGGYGAGTGSRYIPNNLVTYRGNVIVITINYRLGMLGFFPGGGVESTLGLRDQIMALQWVQENIESYGGDPKKVTIFGESAGSQSVSFLTLSPKAKGLFRRAIMQSGVVLSEWFPKVDHKLRKPGLEKKGRELGCTSSDLLECARQIHTDKWGQFVAADIFPFYHPDIDNEVIMADFATNRSLLHPGVDVVMGFNSNDGGVSIFLICSAMMTKPCNPFSGVTHEELFASVQFPKMDKYQQEILVKTYTAWYPYAAPEGKINLVAAAELATDVQYRLPTNEMATNAHKNGNNVYVYEFNSRLENHPLPWRSTWTQQADHGDELGFLFSWLNKTDSNYEVSLRMIDNWACIASCDIIKNWPKFTSAHAEYLLIDDENPGGAPRQPLVSRDKDKFWQHYKETGTFPEWWITSGAPSSYRAMVWTAVLGIIVNLCSTWPY